MLLFSKELLEGINSQSPYINVVRACQQKVELLRKGERMELYILLAIVLAGIICFFLSIRKHTMDLFIGYVFRILFGVVAIYTMNTFLLVQHIVCPVGLNSLNVAVVGVLGVPGFLLLYSVGWYYM